MTTKEYLQQYTCADREMKQLLAEKQHWLDLAARVAPVYAVLPRGEKNSPEEIQTAVDKIVQWDELLDAKAAALVDLRRDVEKTIETVENFNYRTLLRLRYINDFTWERIALEMNYCDRQIMRIHKKALDAVGSGDKPKGAKCR